MAKKIRWYKIYDFAKHGNEPQLPNTLRSVDVEGRRICLAYTDNKYFATDDRCPHAGARLGAGGWCDNGHVVCAIHRHKYNLVTGKGLQGDYLKTYLTELRSDGVYVGFEHNSKWWWPF